MADSKSTAKKPAAAKKATSSEKKATSSVKVTATKIKPASKSADKAAAPKKAASAKPNKISAEERYRMTEVAAYFLAERNKFAGQPVDYWTAAEEQVSKMLKK